jgi:hypothetical protein
VLSLNAVQSFLTARTAELGVAYRDSPLSVSQGRHSGPQPGDHAPQVALTRDDRTPTTLYDQLGHGGFTLLYFTDSGAELARTFEAVIGEIGRVATIGAGGTFFDESRAAQRAFGIQGDGIVLIRPDGYIAYRGPTQVDPLAAYLDRWKAT